MSYGDLWKIMKKILDKLPPIGYNYSMAKQEKITNGFKVILY